VGKDHYDGQLTQGHYDKVENRQDWIGYEKRIVVEGGMRWRRVKFECCGLGREWF
jgi:hypothetical protein